MDLIILKLRIHGELGGDKEDMVKLEKNSVHYVNNIYGDSFIYYFCILMN